MCSFVHLLSLFYTHWPRLGIVQRLTNVQMYKCTNVHQMYKCTNLYQMYKCTSKAKYLSECVEFVWDLVLISALTFQCTHKAMPCFNYD